MAVSAGFRRSRHWLGLLHSPNTWIFIAAAVYVSDIAKYSTGTTSQPLLTHRTVWPHCRCESRSQYARQPTIDTELSRHPTPTSLPGTGASSTYRPRSHTRTVRHSQRRKVGGLRRWRGRMARL